MKYKNLLTRFVDYVKFETRSDENSKSIPTTTSQINFGNKLIEELKKFGIKDIQIIKGHYIIATIPASKNFENVVPIGFIAHMDTADFNAKNVNPRIIENYDSKDIVLNEEKNIKLEANLFPNLKNYEGKTLITTDGTTLLGGDDKAGIAEIMSMVEFIYDNPNYLHGQIKIAFTPDEETGRGADLFDVNLFNVKFAYTLDGGPLGYLEYESFNAAQAIIKLNGVSVHPGYAKNKMINASKLAIEFDNQLPVNEVPEKTEGYEGFYLMTNLNTNLEEGKMTYIVRDHDKQKFNFRKQFLIDTAIKLNKKYNFERFSVEIKDQYYNMREVLEKDMLAVDVAVSAMKSVGVEPHINPIRGGTDGSKISFMGLPTPNLFSGQENMHGKYEFICLETMGKAVDVIIEIISQVVKFKK
ncbi:peptidase T [Spiroplasma endosymbiont of Labia minor]|uniref:peptidase T n=1 Tax=Spiroplasma endosymbiont of Labia minor TaxID=3066305 RepID=UPI0030CB0B72